MSDYCDAIVIGWHYLSNATCLIRPHLFYVHCNSYIVTLFVTLKSTCLGQVVLDKWFIIISINNNIIIIIIIITIIQIVIIIFPRLTSDNSLTTATPQEGRPSCADQPVSVSEASEAAESLIYIYIYVHIVYHIIVLIMYSMY